MVKFMVKTREKLIRKAITEDFGEWRATSFRITTPIGF